MSDVSATSEDPSNTTSYRLARAAVIILGVLLAIAVVMLVVGIVLRMTGRLPAAGAETAGPARFTLAPGARIVTMDAEPGRLILRIRSPSGEEIDIIDTDNGRLVGQVKAQDAPPEKRP